MSTFGLEYHNRVALDVLHVRHLQMYASGSRSTGGAVASQSVRAVPAEHVQADLHNMCKYVRAVSAQHVQAGPAQQVERLPLNMCKRFPLNVCNYVLPCPTEQNVFVLVCVCVSMCVSSVCSRRACARRAER